MGNRPLQNVRKRGPITSQAGGNYVTSAVDIIVLSFLQIPVTRYARAKLLLPGQK